MNWNNFMLVKFTFKEYPEGWLAIGYWAGHVICAIHGVLRNNYFSKIFPPESPLKKKKVSVCFPFLSLFYLKTKKGATKIFLKNYWKAQDKKTPTIFCWIHLFFVTSQSSVSCGLLVVTLVWNCEQCVNQDSVFNKEYSLGYPRGRHSSPITCAGHLNARKTSDIFPTDSSRTPAILLVLTESSSNQGRIKFAIYIRRL